MKQIALRCADRAAFGEGVNHAPELVARIEQEADFGGGSFRQHLAELAQLVERGVRIDRKLLFRLGAERDEARVVMPEEGEVGRRSQWHVHAATYWAAQTTQGACRALPAVGKTVRDFQLFM